MRLHEGVNEQADEEQEGEGSEGEEDDPGGSEDWGTENNLEMKQK